MNALRTLTTIALLFLSGQARAAGPAFTAIAVTPDGTGCVYGSQAGVLARSFASGKDDKLACALENVCALAFARDGKFLAVAGGTPGEHGLVDILTWPGRERAVRLTGHTDLVHAVAWLPDGKLLATASADRSVRLWERASGKCVATLAGHSGPVLALAVSADGRWLCSGSADQTIRVWSVPDRKLVRSLNNHLGAVTALAFRPGAAETPRPYLASASLDGSVRVWQPTIGRLVRIVRQPTAIFALGWSGDGHHLFSAGTDGRLRKIDGDSDTVVATVELKAGRVACLAVRPDGQVLIGHSSGVLAMPAR